MFDAGVARVVVGSLAVKDPETVRRWIGEFGPERIALSLDVRLVDGTPFVASGGWTEDSGQSLWDVAALYPDARHILVTDIGRDGMLEGPNVGLYEEIARRLPDAAVQASGGVSSLADLARAAAPPARSSARLCGRASISLEEAVGLARA